MRINEANIDINRSEGKLLSISIDMPIWDKLIEDNFISVDIPLLSIKTFAKDEDDFNVAIQESVKSFCINAELFGNGLENELKSIGWVFNNQSDDFISMSFTVPNSNSVFDQIMKTGEQFVQKLELAC